MKKLLGFIGILLIYSALFAQSDVNTRVYEIWDDQPAENRGTDYRNNKPGRGFPFDADWEEQAYPIGNGYMGAMIFGRTDTERIQITEKTLANEGLYGIIGNFSIPLKHENYFFTRSDLENSDSLVMSNGNSYTPAP